MPADWLAAILANDVNAPYAMIAIHPDSPAEHEAIRIRLARVKFKHPNRRHIERGDWPLAAPSARAYLAGQTLTHLHTGHSRIQATGGLIMSPGWLVAARTRGRVVVILMEPGSFQRPAGIPDGADMPVDVTEGLGDQLAAIADRRGLLVGYVNTAEVPN